MLAPVFVPFHHPRALVPRSEGEQESNRRWRRILQRGAARDVHRQLMISTTREVGNINNRGQPIGRKARGKWFPRNAPAREDFLQALTTMPVGGHSDVASTARLNDAEHVADFRNVVMF